MTAVWTLGAEADAQRLYEQQELWEESTADHFFEEVLSSVRLLEVFPEIGPGRIIDLRHACNFPIVLTRSQRDHSR